MIATMALSTSDREFTRKFYNQLDLHKPLLPGDPRYVALYHVENTDIYATPGWMAANETPWILRMRRFQRDRTYFMFHHCIA